MSLADRSWAASGRPDTDRRQHPWAVPFGTDHSSYFARASVSSANKAGIAGPFSSARTVHSTQILAFMSVSLCGSIFVGWLESQVFSIMLADHAVLTAGQGREGWSAHRAQRSRGHGQQCRAACKPRQPAWSCRCRPGTGWRHRMGGCAHAAGGMQFDYSPQNLADPGVWSTVPSAYFVGDQVVALVSTERGTVPRRKPIADEIVDDSCRSATLHREPLGHNAADCTEQLSRSFCPAAAQPAPASANRDWFWHRCLCWMKRPVH